MPPKGSRRACKPWCRPGRRRAWLDHWSMAWMCSTPTRKRGGCWRGPGGAAAAWEEAEAADGRVAAAKQQGQDARGVAQQARGAWQETERLLAEVERPEAAWQRARAALAVFRPDGTLNERAAAEGEIEAALAELRGPEWKQVRNVLKDRRS